MIRTLEHKIIAFVILNTILCFFIPQSISAQSSSPLVIRRVGLDSKTINPSEEQTVTLSFEVTKPAKIQVHLYDRLGHEVRSFDLSDVQAGKHSITWDGYKYNGHLASGDIFLYVIEADDGQTEVIYNPAKETGVKIVKAQQFTLDRKTGTFEYVLPNTCMIRLRTGLKNGMLARNLIDWQPCTAGRHTYKWDGKDESGLMDLSNHPELDINLVCCTLPGNTIIFAGPTKPFESSAKYIRPEGGGDKDPWFRKGKYLHYTHDPSSCHEPKFTVSFPNSKRHKEEEIPVVSDTAKVRIELDQRDVRYLINKRFEIMLYVDGVYFFEMEEGSSPLTFNWNTKGLRKGLHILTVNIMSYDGHIGVVSSRIIVGE